MPSWGKTTLKGYDPERFKRMWKQARKATKKDGGDIKDYRAVLGQMRALNPQTLKDGLVPESEKKRAERPRKFDPKHPFRSYLGKHGMKEALEGGEPALQRWA